MVKRLAEVKRLADAQSQSKNSNSICNIFLRVTKESNPLCFGHYIGDEFCVECCFKSRYDRILAQQTLAILDSVLKEKKGKEEIKKDSFLQPENLVKEIVDCRYHSSLNIRINVKKIKSSFPFWKRLQRERFLKEVKELVKVEKESRRFQKEKGRQNRDYWINWINKRIKEE